MTECSKDMNDLLTCLLCGGQYSHLGSHIWHRHKIKAREYKVEFGLDYKTALISETVKKKKQIAFNEDREKYIANLTKAGKKYQFKKGEGGHRTYFSDESKDRYRQQSSNIKIQLKGRCPVCNMGFDNVNSHLFMKHKLKKV